MRQLREGIEMPTTTAELYEVAAADRRGGQAADRWRREEAVRLRQAAAGARIPVRMASRQRPPCALDTRA